MVLDTLTAYDRVQLLEVYARSVMLLELGRCAEWVDLFLPNALVRCAGTGKRASGQFKGRDELLALGRRLMLGEFDVAVGCLVPPSRCRHLLGNITLFGTDTRHALGYGFLTVTTIGGSEPPRWLGSGRYSDRLYKSSGGCWQFENRMFIPDNAEAAAFSANQKLTACAKENVKGIGG
jgi:hypothetical protein